MKHASIFALALLSWPARAAEPTAAEFFEKNVRPVLVEHCQKCHGDKMQKAELKLNSRAALLKGGAAGPVVVPGKPAESHLLQVVKHIGVVKMPPKGKLTDKQIADLETWIKAGAVWPEAAGAKSSEWPTDEQKKWWAFQPVKDVAAPVVQNALWPRGDLDRFILAKLKANSLSPSPPADRRTLLRRVYFDLTGLPPSMEETDSFLNDTSPDAYEKVVDRLLDSPGYGQRWARHWLDVVRYADYHDGNPKARNPVCEPLEAYRYRDWVVRAFNRNLPFDQFIRHQIAGDLLPAPDGKQPYADGLIATTFLVNGAWDRGDADKEKMVSDMVDDQIDTIGKAFMGVTIGCARCHDHKFDPISQRDYYALAGVFYSTRMLQELGTKGGEITLQRRPLVPAEVVAKRDKLLKQIAGLNKVLSEKSLSPDDPTRELLTETRDRLKKELPPEPPLALAVSEGGVPGGLFPKIQDVPLHIRGSYTRLGPVVPRGLPQYLAADAQVKIATGSGRKEVAEWVASPKNPLTARVIVNRVWQWHFGTGLVRTPNNFGLLSEPPSHPELLDWLAAKFIEDGWSLKKLHRRIVLSATYRQGAGNAEADPENRWFGRFAPRRLEAEAIRDAMLFAAGKLDRTPEGPATHDLNVPRRSLYIQTARWYRSNFATLFDAANPDAAVEKRDVSTVAPQALFLLNHEFVLAQAQAVADRATKEEQRDPIARRQRIFQLVLGRNATAQEMEIAAKVPTWRDLAHVLLCSNEFVYLE